MRRRGDAERDSPWRYAGVPLPYVRRYKGLAFASFVLMGLGVVTSLLTPWPLAFLVDSALGTKVAPEWVARIFGTTASQKILATVIATIVIALLTQVLAVLESYVNTKLEQRVALDFRSDLFDHCQNLSQAYHDERSTGMFMYQINFEAHNAGVIAVAIPSLLQSILTILGMFYITYLLAPPLALLSMAVIPPIYYSTIYYSRRIEPSVQRVRSLEGLSLQIVSDAFSMLRIVVAFNRQRHEWEKFRRQGQSAVDARVKVTVAQTVFGLVVAVTTAVGTGLIIGVGAHSVLRRVLTVGELLIILSYISDMYNPLTTISSTLAGFQQELVGLRAAKRLLDTKPEVDDAPHAEELRDVAGNVTFEGVSFSYKTRRETLSDVSFGVSAGDVVAVVGPTGAGKTTLVNLIPRFYDPDEGRILVDGRDLRGVTQRTLRDHISLVPQEPVLFEASIAENIRYGRLDATDEEVEAAAQAANAHDFITRLPDQYRTHVGERGGRLSGGERQRICVARAFVKNAPILILDEPTASVDSRTESVILEALERLMEGRTTFMVAHRLSTIRRARHILVMNDGELVEMGSHDELLDRNGLYRLLWEVQVGGSTLPVPVGAPAEDQPTNGSRTSATDGHSAENGTLLELVTSLRGSRLGERLWRGGRR
jgi:ATP-binding cassette, subfamily B, bacterial